MRQESDCNAYSMLPTSLRSVSMTQSLMGKTNAFLRSINSKSALQGVKKNEPEVPQTAAQRDKSMKILEELRDTKDFFTQHRGSSIQLERNKLKSLNVSGTVQSIDQGGLNMTPPESRNRMLRLNESSDIEDGLIKIRNGSNSPRTTN